MYFNTWKYDTFSLFLLPPEMLIILSVKNILSHLLLCITNSNPISNISHKDFPDHPNLDLMPLLQGLMVSCSPINIPIHILYQYITHKNCKLHESSSCSNSFIISALNSVIMPEKQLTLGKYLLGN